MGLEYTNIIKVNKDDICDLISYLENRYRFYFLNEDCVGLTKFISRLGRDYTINEVGAVISLNDTEDILYCESIKDFPEDICEKFDCVLVVRDINAEYSVYSREGYISPKQISFIENDEDYILELLGVDYE